MKWISTIAGVLNCSVAYSKHLPYKEFFTCSVICCFSNEKQVSYPVQIWIQIPILMVEKSASTECVPGMTGMAIPQQQNVGNKSCNASRSLFHHTLLHLLKYTLECIWCIFDSSFLMMGRLHTALLAFQSHFLSMYDSGKPCASLVTAFQNQYYGMINKQALMVKLLVENYQPAVLLSSTRCSSSIFSNSFGLPAECIQSYNTQHLHWRTTQKKYSMMYAHTATLE